MSSNHIVKSYDQELAQLVRYAAQMGSLVEEQFAAAIQAIHARDNEIAGRTFASDTAIDTLENELNELALRILALRQPMAGDLRLIIGSMKIARDLERIGDYAASLAKRSRNLNAVEKISPTITLVRMANQVSPILKQIVDAYTNNDVDQATAAYEHDDIIDESYHNLITELMQYMQKHPESIKECTHLLFMAKNLERIGDRATNIAETVHFIVKGSMPLIRKPKVLPDLHK